MKSPQEAIENIKENIDILKELSKVYYSPDSIVWYRNELRDIMKSLEKVEFLTGNDYLLLKWGTLKSWDFAGDRANELLNEYSDIGSCMSVALQKDTKRQKEIICELIDICDSPIQEDWGGMYMTKAEAKEYVLNYNNK